jgi:hypothetical protein
MERIHNARSLNIGDVLLVQKYVDSKAREPFWTQFFACVTGVPQLHSKSQLLKLVEVVELKLRPTAREFKQIHLIDSHYRVQRLAENEWPPGVIAMRMKLIMTGKLSLGTV